MTRVRFREQCPDQITGTLVDQQGVAVAGTRVTGITLTLWDLETGVLSTSPQEGIINGRSDDDVLGSGEASVDADGVFVLQLSADDNAIVNSRRQVERHRALLKFTWTADEAIGSTNVEIEIEVENLGRL